MSGIKKDKILKLLLKVYDDNSYTTSRTTDGGKTLSVEDIHRKTNYSLDSVNLLIGALHYNDYIKKFRLHGKGETDFWGITDKGRNAISENNFVWYYKTDNIFKVIGLALALFGTLNSIFHFTDR
ncbi:hypothetical protein [Algibacter sp. L1A34]|uniref:hypothetical protein n=1 Tax=Algibacter sp. L1A34 TaxID=2686365 RepID=UPI00131AEE0A|nr:hypothetical protein [Algibacter sp. L1A34]